MPNWKDRAIIAFPNLRNEIGVPEYSIYELFFDLLPLVREAHRDCNASQLRAIYGFAEWCARQPEKKLRNTVYVAFYEHLFDQSDLAISEILSWLKPEVRESCRGLWKCRLASLRFEELDRLSTTVKFQLAGAGATDP